MSLGENIKDLRKLRMMTQKELSEATGIKVAHLSRIENDEGDLKLSTLKKLLEALKCTPNDLLLDEESSLDAQIIDGFEKIQKLPLELKKEVNSIISKYLVFNQINDMFEIGNSFMGITMEEAEQITDEMSEQLLIQLKNELKK